MCPVKLQADKIRTSIAHWHRAAGAVGAANIGRCIIQPGYVEYIFDAAANG